MARRTAIRAATHAAPTVSWIVANTSAGGEIVSTPPTQTIRIVTSDL
jgi:hypothetical protein